MERGALLIILGLIGTIAFLERESISEHFFSKNNHGTHKGNQQIKKRGKPSKSKKRAREKSKDKKKKEKNIQHVPFSRSIPAIPLPPSTIDLDSFINTDFSEPVLDNKNLVKEQTLLPKNEFIKPNFPEKPEEPEEPEEPIEKISIQKEETIFI